MRSSWKLLPLAALMALGLLALLRDGPGRPRTASAAFVCTEGDTGTLRVDIIDDDTDARITVAGAVVKFTPNTQTGTSTENVTDNSSEDNSTSVGRITQNNACSTTGSDTYEAELVSLPDALDDCDIIDDTDTGALDADTTTTLDLHVDCSDVATSTPTTTVAAGVTVASSFASLSCNSFSVITVTVRDGGGNPLPNVTLNVAASIGSVSPTQVTTGTGGAATTLYTAPATQGGTATVTATVASTTVSGSTTILINCAATPTATTVPPTATATRAPTTGLGAPSTGDGGLADGGGTGWPVYAGFVLTASALIGGVIAFRVRA